MEENETDKIESGYYAYLVFNQLEHIQKEFNAGHMAIPGLNLLGVFLEVIGGDDFKDKWNALLRSGKAGEMEFEDLYLEAVSMALHVLQANKILYKSYPKIKGKYKQ
jgi:hypothetical protein